MHLECLSHTPLFEYVQPADSVLAEVERQQAAARARVEAYDPELVLLFAPDHFNGFFHDLMPPFCLGVEAEAIGDYGSAAGRLPVPRELAEACAGAVIAADLDLAVSYRMKVDHGFAQALEVLGGGLDRYPVLPVFINAIGAPLPPWRRVRRLGEAMGRFVAGLGKRVLVVGSGGLSHEPPLPQLATAPPEVAERLIDGRNPTAEQRAARQKRVIEAGRGFADGSMPLRPLNPDWDKGFMETLRRGELAAMDEFGDAWVTEQAGASGHESRTWLAAFAALAAAGDYEAKVEYYHPIKEWIAGFALMSARSQTQGGSK